jgi:hypothetical protein
MNPVVEYTRRLAHWNSELSSTKRRFVLIGNLRLGVAIFAALLAWLAFKLETVTGWSLLLPLAVFITLVIIHERVVRIQTVAERAAKYYKNALARLDDSWAGNGNSGDAFRDDNHVYADDLDVFGKGSLFELIDAARTGAGERTLAHWLLTPATRDEALSRQNAIQELSTRIDLREDLALMGEDIRVSVHAAMLQNWGTAAPVPFHPLLRMAALTLAVAGVVAFAAFMAHLVPLFPFIVILGADFLLIARVRHRVAQVAGAVETPGTDLLILKLVLERLEREQFASPRLNAIRERLQPAGLPASVRIATLQRWIEWLDSSDHLLVRVIRPVLLWKEQLAMAIEAWRSESGRYIGDWMAAVGEFEALSSLAALAFERPHWIFPTLSESPDACFEAQAMQHPLIPAAKCVPNDASLGGNLRLLIVSGSNMSGKSTFLRAIGLNAVLAWAGAPVAAKHLTISALQPASSIRVTDSLQDNRSRFYAEITRIRQILDLASGPRPVLFLLDELLSGTNSHDRRIGAAAIVRSLLRRNAIGLITTHDLALAEIERDFEHTASNVHFDDKINEGHISFDYRLRPGVVTHSNALELMRSVGLEV